MTTATRSVRAAAGALGAAVALATAGLAWAPPASAAVTPNAGAFADSAALIVDGSILVIPLQPLQPVAEALGLSSQSCPAQAAEPASTEILDQSIPGLAPAIEVLTTGASADCRDRTDPMGVAGARVENVELLEPAASPVPLPIPLPVPGALITATTLQAVANSSCKESPNADGTQIVGLSIGGQAIPTDVPPNTRIPVLEPLGISIIVNEQHPTASGRGIVVNALHVIGNGPIFTGDLIVSHAVSGVSCTSQPTTPDVGEGLEAPEITFAKTAAPTTAKAGDTVVYTTTVNNTSEDDCTVLRYVDHLNPAFDFVSTAGAFGTEADSVERQDGGIDAVLRPADLVIAGGASATQTFTVKLKADVAPGTYFNNLELFCGLNGDFASGPLAPVTVPAAVTPPVVKPPVTPPAGPAPVALPRTGGPEWTTPLALVLLAGAGGLVVARRRATV